jgi:8-amino-7-oxononanoate synthase
MDIFEKFTGFTTAKIARERGIYPYFHMLESKQDTQVVMEGKRKIMLGSNNYVGLTADSEVIEAGVEGLKNYGTGCSGSRFLNGTLNLHVKLEKELAEFLDQEACVTFSTGFQSNLGIISSIVGRHDYVIIDKEDHASIYDGCRLSFGKMLRYAHSDMNDLEEKLKIAGESGKLIVTDGVFSMSGDICKLDKIVDLAKKYGARVMVDDAHGLGVLGKGGRGTASHFGLEKEVDIIMGTFSKSLASIGGYMASSEYVADYVRHTSRPFIFCASIPPSAVMAANAALSFLKNHPERSQRLSELTAYMKQGLKKRGIKIIESDVPIIPIYTYDVMETLAISKELFDEGVYLNPVIPPATGADECLLRVSLMATHSEELLDEAMDIIKSVLVRHGIK